MPDLQTTAQFYAQAGAKTVIIIGRTLSTLNTALQISKKSLPQH
jgi:hypothetical protein